MGTVAAVVVVKCPPRGGDMYKLDTGRLIGAGNVQADTLGITWPAGI